MESSCVDGLRAFVGFCANAGQLGLTLCLRESSGNGVVSSTTGVQDEIVERIRDRGKGRLHKRSLERGFKSMGRCPSGLPFVCEKVLTAR